MLYEIIAPQRLTAPRARATLLQRLRLQEGGQTLLVTQVRGQVVDAWLAQGAGFLVLQSCGLVLTPEERFLTTEVQIAAYVAQVNAHPGGAASLLRENARLQKVGMAVVQCDAQRHDLEFTSDAAAPLLTAAAALFTAAPCG